MANPLNINIRGRVVLIKKEALKPEFQNDDKARAFLCLDGFGTVPFTSGHVVSGYFLDDGIHCQFSSEAIERLAPIEITEYFKAKGVLG